MDKLKAVSLALLIGLVTAIIVPVYAWTTITAMTKAAQATGIILAAYPTDVTPAQNVSFTAHLNKPLYGETVELFKEGASVDSTFTDDLGYATFVYVLNASAVFHVECRDLVSNSVGLTVRSPVLSK